MRNAPHSLSSEDWEKISHATENFTGADIKRTCSSAIVSACIKRGDSECGISLKDILDSVNDLKCVG